MVRHEQKVHDLKRLPSRRRKTSVSSVQSVPATEMKKQPAPTTPPRPRSYTIPQPMSSHGCCTIDPAYLSMPSTYGNDDDEAGMFAYSFPEISPVSTHESLQTTSVFGETTQSSPPSAIFEDTPVISDATKTTLSNTINYPGFYHVTVPLTLPSLSTLSSLVFAYFEEVHPHLPFIHRPTLNLNRPHGGLVLSIAAMGALQQGDVAFTRTLFEGARKVVQVVLDEERANAVSGGRFASPPVWLIQSLVLNILLGLHSNEASATEIALAQAEGAVDMIRSIGMLHEQKCQYKSYAEWAAAEESKRTVFALFSIMTLLICNYNHTTPLRTKDIDLFLPCSEYQFSITEQQWQQQDPEQQPAPQSPFHALHTPITKDLALLNPFAAMSLLASMTIQDHDSPVNAASPLNGLENDSDFNLNILSRYVSMCAGVDVRFIRHKIWRQDILSLSRGIFETLRSLSRQEFATVASHAARITSETLRNPFSINVMVAFAIVDAAIVFDEWIFFLTGSVGQVLCTDSVSKLADVLEPDELATLLFMSSLFGIERPMIGLTCSSLAEWMSLSHWGTTQHNACLFLRMHARDIETRTACVVLQA